MPIRPRTILLPIVVVAAGCADPVEPMPPAGARHGIGAFGSGHRVETDTTEASSVMTSTLEAPCVPGENRGIGAFGSGHLVETTCP